VPLGQSNLQSDALRSSAIRSAGCNVALRQFENANEGLGATLARLGDRFRASGRECARNLFA
jgi:hypothetical protein